MAQPSTFYRMVTKGDQLGIGVAGSHFIRVSAVAKKPSPGKLPYCIPNELICGEIGRFLRLRIPPCAVVRSSDPPREVWFASLDFTEAGDTPAPVGVKGCAACATKEPDLSTGLLCFDILIANPDRHGGNIAFDVYRRRPQLRIFDHSHALFGCCGKGQGIDSLRSIGDAIAISGKAPIGGNRHCLLDHLATDEHLAKWEKRVRDLPGWFIDETCNGAIDLGVTATEAQEAAAFIKRRRDNLRNIIDGNHAEFAAIRQWGASYE
jgi:hypothetical protein